MLDDTLLIDREFLRFRIGLQWAVVEQAIQQERVEKADFLFADADGQERVQIETAHFEVLDARGSQHRQWALTRLRLALRTNRSVELVFDLQQRRRQLSILAVDLHPD